MFPELNNLLSTTPDSPEQVRSRRAGRGRVPGACGKIASGMLRGGAGAAAVNSGNLGVVVWRELSEALVRFLDLLKGAF